VLLLREGGWILFLNQIISLQLILSNKLTRLPSHKQTVLLMKQMIQLIFSKQATLLYSCAQTYMQQLPATVQWPKPPLKLLQGHLTCQAHLQDGELWILPEQRVMVRVKKRQILHKCCMFGTLPPLSEKCSQDIAPYVLLTPIPLLPSLHSLTPASPLIHMLPLSIM
jgi:hypothetical protein